MSQQQLCRYLTEGQLPLLLASLAFGTQHIKIFNKGRNTLFFHRVHRIHFFSTEFTESLFLVAVSTIISGLQKTESEKPHIILTNANLQHQQKILKIKPNQNRPPPTPSQAACSSVRKRHPFSTCQNPWVTTAAASTQPSPGVFPK